MQGQTGNQQSKKKRRNRKKKVAGGNAEGGNVAGPIAMQLEAGASDPQPKKQKAEQKKADGKDATSRDVKFGRQLAHSGMSHRHEFNLGRVILNLDAFLYHQIRKYEIVRSKLLLAG